MPGNYSDNKVFPWAYFLAVAAAELMVAFDKACAGLILYFILLAAVFIQSIRSYPSIQVNAAQNADDESSNRRVLPDSRTRFYLALMLVPLIRIVGLPLFLADFPMAYRLILVGLPLFTAAFLIIRFAGYKAQDIYLTFSSPVLYFLTLQLIIGVTGIPLGLLEHKILPDIPSLFPPPFSHGFAAFILICFSGFLEELIFRGVLLRAAGDHMGKITGSIYASCLFAALQIPRLIFLEVVFVFLVGLLFCWMVRRTQSIWGVALAHGLMNMILYLDVY